MHRMRRYLNLETLARVAADAILFNLGMAGGLTLRFTAVVLAGAEQHPTVGLREALQASTLLYLQGCVPLTILGIATFAMSGCYTRGRVYRSRYKVLVLAQAVSLTYLLFVAVTYFVPFFSRPSRSGLILGWLVTTILIVGARFWGNVWRRVVAAEFGEQSAGSRPIGRVLVIGGAGYIGSVLCRQLLECGYKVRALDLLLYGDESLRDLMARKDFELIRGDSRNIENLVRSMRGVDAVVHLGEIVGDAACDLDEQVTQEVNLAATRMAAEAAKGYRVERFVYASSCSVYGASDQIVDEQSATNPVSLYARLKIGSEHALLGLRSQDFHPVILRLATAYGGSPRPRFDLVVNRLTATAVTEGKVTIFGGSQWRPFVHVSDVARAVVLCLEKPLGVVDGEIFNVGSNEQNQTVVEIGELVCRLFPTVRLDVQDEGIDRRNYRVSFDKIAGRLDYGAQVDLTEGIRELHRILTNGTIRDYRDSRYNNVQFLATEDGNQLIKSAHVNGLYKPGMVLREPQPRPELIVGE